MSTTEQPSLFAAAEDPPAHPRDARAVGLRPAAARLVITTSPDLLDREQRPLLLLVIDCPFCPHQHVHPAGHVGSPRLCPRRARCVGRIPGAYYFPEVQR
ncbi:hypothetical protein [Streptomyces sp. IBSBF 2435]|uniref:hypothetical protein n=1 Tax=Streptomyces sp. IBSBF 2435 TaxID=2903531 RepID=UPI002FDBE2F6